MHIQNLNLHLQHCKYTDISNITNKVHLSNTVTVCLLRCQNTLLISYNVSWWRQHGDYFDKKVWPRSVATTARRTALVGCTGADLRWRLYRVDSVFILPDITTWLYQGTGLQRTDVTLSSLLDRQLGMTCLMNCVTFLFLGLFLEVVLKLIFSPTTIAPSALEVFHYNALYKFMFTIYITSWLCVGTVASKYHSSCVIVVQTWWCCCSCSVRGISNGVHWYRFKVDAADLEFVEKVARWLTNSQVQIKSEVAQSNSECCAIDESLNRLECLVKLCEEHDADTGASEVRVVVIIFLPVINWFFNCCHRMLYRLV